MTDAEAPKVTIVVTQRERFSGSLERLASLYAHTPEPFELVYVDGRAPREIAGALRAESARRGFRLIRREHYLPPNHARNLGLAEARTPWVVFVDNDVFFEDGWLSALLACGEETGADLVTPVVLMGRPDDPGTIRVHFVFGSAWTETGEGGPVFHEQHHLSGRRPEAVAEELTRRPSDFTEFHCVLARRESLEALGGLDPRLTGAAEHLDLGRSVRERGGIILLEPTSRVTYAVGVPLERRDLPFFCLRWSDRWALASEHAFLEKWGLAPDATHKLGFLRTHREIPFRTLQRRLQPVVGWTRSKRLGRGLYRALEGWAARHAAV
jgi:GT2 family glycosyltransferase